MSGTRNFLTSVKTTAIAYGRRIGRGLKALVACNSRRVHKRPEIASAQQTPTGQQIPGNPQNSGYQLTPYHPSMPGNPDTSEIIIAVMGVTGAGKSYFIREVTGDPNAVVGGGLNSCTSEVQSFRFQYQGVNVTLVDTPGFDDTYKNDTDILKNITDWTTETYKQDRLLTGIIYLHRITDIRMGGSALKNLRMFRKLCGDSAMKNVFLTTTQWCKVDTREGERRETELREPDFWGKLLEKGATLQRFQGTRESGLELIRKLISNNPNRLDVQHQMVDKGFSLIDTSAGQTLNEELLALQKTYQEELENLKKENQKVIMAKEQEMKEMIAEEQAKAQEKLDRAIAEQKRLADLRDAESRKREAQERKIQKEMRLKDKAEAQTALKAVEDRHAKEIKKHQEEQAMQLKREEDMRKRVIAVANCDINAPVHIINCFEGYNTKGRFVVDTSNPEEFDSKPFNVTIHYDRNFVEAGIASAFKTFGQIVDDSEGMTQSNYIDHDDKRYWYKPGSAVKRGNAKFIIFQRRAS